MPLDFPQIAGLSEQKEEFFYKRLVEQIPGLADKPDTIYGDKELAFFRLVNQGTIKSVSELDIPVRLSQTELDKRYINNNELVINVMNYGAVGDGVANDSPAFTDAFNTSRTFGARVYVPKSTVSYYLPTTVDCSGIDVYSDRYGYQGAKGAILKGNGSNVIFSQLSVTADSLTMRISGLRFIECQTGIKLSYCVYSHIVDVTVFNASGPGIIMGDNTIIGPLFNEFHRVHSYSTNGSGLEMYGKDWCNNNLFVNCDFKGTGAPAVRMDTVGGYGAINNIFTACEIRGDNVGAYLNGTNVTTKFQFCYFESQGPSVWMQGISRDVEMLGCVYGTLKNTNITGKPNYIHHAGPNTASVKIQSGWVTTGTTAEFENLRLVGSDTPANLSMHFIDEPRLDAQATGFKLFDDATFSAATRTFRGNVVIQSRSAPSFILQYPDGTFPLEIKLNGVMGTSHFGAQIRHNNNTAMIINASGQVAFQQDIATNKSVTAATLGALTRVWPVRDNNGTIVGYSPLYATYS